MRVLVVGAGGVGSAFVSIAARRPAFAAITVADIDGDRARSATDTERGDGALDWAVLDATDPAAVTELARECRADVVLNACDPRFNPPIFQGVLDAGCHYVDMAMNLSEPHPTEPYRLPGVLLGAEQLAADAAWRGRGAMALLAMGVEPGFSDVAARFAADAMFTEIDEIGVRDGSDLVIEGPGFTPTFSIWTTIEECLNPPLVHTREDGIVTTEPFSGRETFTFPDGIGPLDCFNVEHEEVILIPRVIDAGRVTFKYGLDERFVGALRTLHDLGLDSTEPIEVDGVRVAPRSVVAAALPDPATLGHAMSGRTCAGTWVVGTGTDGRARETYLHHIVDNAWSMREFGHQAVVWQTALMPVVAMELMASGAWTASGVVTPEELPPQPFVELLAEHGAPMRVVEYADRAPAAPATEGVAG